MSNIQRWAHEGNVMVTQPYGVYVTYKDYEADVARLNKAWQKAVDIQKGTIELLRERLHLAKEKADGRKPEAAN
jgi:hypothetical protein